MSNITANEKKVLLSIRNGHYSNGDPLAAIWSWSINDSSTPSGLPKRSLSGVVSSLKKKGLVECSGYGEEACVGLTPEGLKVVEGEKSRVCPVCEDPACEVKSVSCGQ